jgi:hypothetical protein
MSANSTSEQLSEKRKDWMVYRTTFQVFTVYVRAFDFVAAVAVAVADADAICQVLKSIS